MYELVDGDIIAVVYSVRHGSGYRMILQWHHSVLSQDDAMVVPMRKRTLWNACRQLAMGKKLPYAPIIRPENDTVALIESDSGRNPVPLPSDLYALLPVRVVCKPYDLTCDMMQWLGIPSHMAGVYTGMSHAYNTVLPVRIG